MNKNIISILFSILLLALVAAPSIIKAIDDSVDISMFYSVSEEEEISKIKITAPKDSSPAPSLLSFLDIESIAYYFKTYPKPHLNLISPPPEVLTA